MHQKVVDGWSKSSEREADTFGVVLGGVNNYLSWNPLLECSKTELREDILSDGSDGMGVGIEAGSTPKVE